MCRDDNDAGPQLWPVPVRAPHQPGNYVGQCLQWLRGELLDLRRPFAGSAGRPALQPLRLDGLHKHGATDYDHEHHHNDHDGRPMTMIDRWRPQHAVDQPPTPYGGDESYDLAAAFLGNCYVIEDRGCGTGYFAARYPDRGIVGVDGTKTPAVAFVTDLTSYRRKTDGILLRHVLEHNHDWPMILFNALADFKRGMVLILCTPLDLRTGNVGHHPKTDTPIYSFSERDLATQFLAHDGLIWRRQTIHSPQTMCGVETLFYFDREENYPKGATT